jgi:prepilin-type N-terminal cleavage/methylation domain-containing protein
MNKTTKIPECSKSVQLNILRAAGFTIIELMIAAAIFSLILLLITFGVIKFNQAYYGGVVQSSTQNVARAIMSNISQAIQLDGGAINTTNSGSWYGICIGNQYYQYDQGQELISSGTLGPDQVRNALVYEPDVSSCTGIIPGSNVSSGTEMLGEHMRVANLQVTPVSGTTNLYRIDVRIVYGDDDLICSLTKGGCNSPASIIGATATDAECKSNTGTPQFCAMTDLSTTVEKRIN